MKTLSGKNCISSLAVLAVLAVLSLLTGCQDADSKSATKTPISRQNPKYRYARVDMANEHIAIGLRSLFEQMAQAFGPIDETNTIINTYSPQIRQGLYNCGFCRITALPVNTTVVDIDIYFRVKPKPMTLVMEVFPAGGVNRVFYAANQYAGR